MKIAQVMAGAPTGGAELFFERLTIALAAMYGTRSVPAIAMCVPPLYVFLPPPAKFAVHFGDRDIHLASFVKKQSSMPRC